MSSPSDSRPGRGAAVPTSAPGLDLSSVVRAPLHAWRSSVALRVVATTLALSLLVLVPYYSFMLVIAFQPDLLRQTLGEGVATVGWPIGALLVVGSWLLTGVYVRRANGEFDRLNEEVLKESWK